MSSRSFLGACEGFSVGLMNTEEGWKVPSEGETTPTNTTSPTQ